jgi:hypothetical protein
VPIVADAAVSAPTGVGTLGVSSVPDGDVEIDGHPSGTTPLEISLGAGTHEVRVRLGGFEEWVETVEVPVGGRSHVVARLVARDVEDRQVLQLLAAQAKVWMQPFEPPAAERGGGDASMVVVVYPRGALRRDDLGEMRIDFPAKPPPGEVRFRRGNEVIHAMPVDATEGGAWVRPVPEGARAALGVGDAVSWGWFPAKGEAAEASFEVVDKNLEATFASLEVGLQGQPKSAVSYLKIQLLADAGLPYGAHGEAMRLIKQGQGAVRAWAAALDSLERMGVPKTSLAWREAQSRLAGFSRAQQSEVFSGGDYATIKLLDQMRLGHAGRVLQSLDAERLSTLAQSTLDARRITTQAAANASSMAERSPSSARKLADTLLRMAQTARDQAPQDPEARWALAQAQVGQARTLRATGGKVKTDAWREAAETLLGSYELGVVDEGVGFAQAAAWLREAAAIASPPERLKLLEAAKEVAEKAKAKFPDAPGSAVALATHLLARADGDPPKQAKAAVLEAVRLLEPHLKQDPTPATVATAHADLVTVDARRGLKAGLEYRTETVVSSPDLARYRLPASERWFNGDDLPAGYVAYLEQRGADGDVLRQITVRSVGWSSDYEFPSGLVAGGQNTSLLAKHDLTESRRGLARVKEAGRVEKARFSKTFPKADAYETSGIDHDGATRRIRGWVFRSSLNQVTYLVTIEEFRGADEDDPELEVFRDSFADVTPAK